VKPGTHCTEGWLDPSVGQVGCGKPHPQWNSKPEPSSP